MPPKYDETSIDLIQNVAHVRERPHMYIYDEGRAGLHQLAKEVLDNCIDEFMAGAVKKILVGLSEDRSEIIICDDGRGIPVEKHSKSGFSTLTTILTMTGAGGKFRDGAYSVSAGLHGVGLTVVNALSEYLEVWSVRGKKWYYQGFEQGAPVTKVLTQAKAEKRGIKYMGLDSGVSVLFKPDPAIFTVTKFDPEWLAEYLRIQSYLCAGLKIEFVVAGEGGSTRKFCATGGIKQFLGEEADKDGVTPMHKPVVYKDDELEVALLWTNSTDEKWFTYVNSSPTKDGGTHVKGLKRLITQLLASRAKSPIDNDDVRAGLYVGLHLKLKDPKYKGQTKDSLQNDEAITLVYNKLKDVFEHFVLNDDSISEILIRASKLKKAKDHLKKERAVIAKLTIPTKQKKGILPGKLAEAPFCKPQDRELFIVEGDSASGTAKQARDTKFQEVLPLRGKLPNASRWKMADILKNSEIKDMITSIGVDILDKCNPSRARVGKVLLTMDADPDGQHIASLVLSFLVNYMSPLIDAGMVYIVDSPLFKASYRDRRVFGNSLEEIRAQLPKSAKPEVSRLKGHGEANPSELREYAMSKSTRKLYKVVFRDGDVTVVADIMGNDASFRRELLGIA
jgi:DNA gyrase/topoisomerase IV subunit B